MELAFVSEKKLRATFGLWQVDDEYAQPMYNYLVHGFEPGSFFTSVLANDFHMAMARSHPANSIPALKALSGWIGDYMPREAWGNYQAVDVWVKAKPEYRRSVLETRGLIYTPEYETLETLKA